MLKKHNLAVVPKISIVEEQQLRVRYEESKALPNGLVPGSQYDGTVREHERYDFALIEVILQLRNMRGL